jgi:hypothetical protein
MRPHGIDVGGVALTDEPALLPSAGRIPERRQHRESGGHDGRSERPGETVWAAPTFTTEAPWPRVRAAEGANG